MIITRNEYKQGPLAARPKSKAAESEIQTGVQPLNIDGSRDGFINVPTNYHHNKPAALAVMLHGAGGRAEHGLHLLHQYADDSNMILLAPASREATWDIITKNAFNGYIIFIDQALNLVFSRYYIDLSHIAVDRFSDGASYALGVGLSNVDLFTHILAFSPGFCYFLQNRGKPSVFISHGVHDHILPIVPCSRKIVPELYR